VSAVYILLLSSSLQVFPRFNARQTRGIIFLCCILSFVHVDILFLTCFFHLLFLFLFSSFLDFRRDIESEVERFIQAWEEAIKKYTYLERPRGTAQQQADLAVDALCALCLNLPDGEAVAGEEEAALVAAAAEGGLRDLEGVAEAVARSLASREERRGSYM
jgi:hypothetical protein